MQRLELPAEYVLWPTPTVNPRTVAKTLAYCSCCQSVLKEAQPFPVRTGWWAHWSPTNNTPQISVSIPWTVKVSCHREGPLPRGHCQKSAIPSRGQRSEREILKRKYYSFQPLHYSSWMHGTTVIILQKESQECSLSRTTGYHLCTNSGSVFFQGKRPQFISVS